MNYWQKRATELENRTYNQSKKNYKQIEEAFNKAQAKINEKIEKWYIRLAENNNIDIADAKRFLNESELKEFKWTLDEYIEHGRENAIDQRWLKELENASAKFHISKLNAELIEIRAEYEKAFAKENQVVEETIKESYTDRYDHMAYEIQKGYGVGFKVAGIDSEQLDKAIKKPWASDGKNFSDRIWSKKTQMVDTLHSEIIRSMLTGGNTKEAISIMQKYVRNDVKNAKYAAARLIRTESAYFASEGQKKCFNDLDVEKYEIVATLDNRTSDICQGMDGQVFEMKDFETGVTAPPFHVNCRSTTAPYFDDEFAKGERAARGADGETYYVPSDMTYKEWKEKQDDLKNDKEEKKEPNVIRFNDITDKWTEKTKEGSYTECDSITVNGKTYKVGDNGVVLDLNNRTSEVEIAKVLAEKYGKEVVMLPEISGDNRYIHMADLMVNGKPVEIKTINASGPNTIKNAIKHAKKQANDIIINIGDTKLTTDEIIETIQKQFNNTQCQHMETCVVMKDGEVLKVFEKKNIGTAAMLKHHVIPTIDNITTKPQKSQLKSDEKDGKINIINSPIDLFKQIGFKKVDEKIHELDQELIGKNIEQLKLLEEKFGIIKQLNVDIGVEKNKSKNSVVYADVKTRLTDMFNETLNFYDIYEDYKKFSSEMNEVFDKKLFMPCLEENYSIYAITHEYGHLIHNFLINKELGTDKTMKDYNKWLENAEDRIYSIALKDNTNISFKDLIHMKSEYARTSSAEFFAECFANSQMGKTNALGDAIIKLLREKGIKLND